MPNQVQENSTKSPDIPPPDPNRGVGASRCARGATDSGDLLEKLMAQHARMVRSVVFRVGGPAARALADDVAQQVFLELWKQLERGRKIEHPTSYLYRSAVRETIRSLRTERRLDGASDNGETIEQMPDPARGPGARVRRLEVSDNLRGAAAELLPYRATAVRAHLYGFTVREIMRREGWSYNRARNLIARGMADLRRGLEARGCTA